MKIQIDLDGADAPYLQIVKQVKALVASGQLQPGQEMTPIRELSRQLNINPNTVVRAYRELEMAGVVYKRESVGTYVSKSPPTLVPEEEPKTVNVLVQELLEAAEREKVSLEELIRKLLNVKRR